MCKYLREEPRGSDALTWTQWTRLIALVSKYRWPGVDPKHMKRLCILSTWCALRQSESLVLSPLHSIMEGGRLRMDFPNDKSGTSVVHSKFISEFGAKPEYCPVKAWDSLMRTFKRHKFNSGSFIRKKKNNQCISATWLNTNFAKFITEAKRLKILPQHGKYTWHVWRVSFFNFAFYDLQCPGHVCSSIANHDSLLSRLSYTKHTNLDRKREAGDMIAARFDEAVAKRRKHELKAIRSR